MDSSQFDGWTRRRFGLATSGLVAAALGLAGLTDAGARRKKKRNKPKPNEYGCLNVGQPCGGKDARCCSGICQGKKPKKGKRDRSRCVAHDTGGCTLDNAFCVGGTDRLCGPTDACVCNMTTGRAPHCGGAVFCPAIECQRDADCDEPGAACIPAALCVGCGDPSTQNFCQRPCGG